MVEPVVTLREYLEVQILEIRRRLDESAEDRARIRRELGDHVRVETFHEASNRIAALERIVARLYGGLAVLVALLAILGVVLRYLLGP